MGEMISFLLDIFIYLYIILFMKEKVSRKKQKRNQSRSEGNMSEVVQVNVSMEIETANQLDQLAHEDGYDNRSAFVRWLIRQEYGRRFINQNPPFPVRPVSQRAPGAE